jgi:16S rRNA (cytosine1402-N4)-methyltransferase
MKNEKNKAVHIPVLLDEICHFLGGLEPLIDCTLGYGGHLEALLKVFDGEVDVLALDRDQDMLLRTKNKMAKKKTISWVHGRFSDVEYHQKKWGCKPKAILADLGVSSWQLDEASRGFSMKRDGPLDMRMDRTQKKTLRQMLCSLSEKELREALRREGDEKRATAIARAIKKEIAAGRLRSTLELSRLIAEISGPCSNRDPATRTFLALRRLVNDEAWQIDTFLQKAPICLAPGGRLAVITFHSGEDRAVKQSFQRWARKDDFRLLTKKPLEASAREKKENPRSRSAKLRVLERVMI